MKEVLCVVGRLHVFHLAQQVYVKAGSTPTHLAATVHDVTQGQDESEDRTHPWILVQRLRGVGREGRERRGEGEEGGGRGGGRERREGEEGEGEEGEGEEGREEKRRGGRGGEGEEEEEREIQRRQREWEQVMVGDEDKRPLNSVLISLRT